MGVQSTKNSLCFVTKADSAFYPGAAALIRSVRRAHPKDAAVVMNGGLTRSEVKSLERLGATVVPLRKEYVPRPATIAGTHYNPMIFALMEFGSLPFSRIVHLDADTVVLGSLAELIDELDHFDFVGVADHPALSLAENVGDLGEQRIATELFGIDSETLARVAFNAGVFAISATAYRRILPLMEKAYRSRMLLPLRDQTMLNMALAAAGVASAPPLPIHYNFRHWFRRSPTTRWDSVENVEGVLVPNFGNRPIKILHFIGPKKPWHADFVEFPEALQIWRQFGD